MQTVGWYAGMLLTALSLVACASADEGQGDGSVLRQAVQIALRSLPYDSVCTPDGCRVVVVDPRVRETPGAVPADPERLPVFLELTDTDIAQLVGDGRQFLLDKRNSNLLAQTGDSLIVFLQVRNPSDGEADAEPVEVMCILRSISWFGGVAIFSMDRSEGEWVVESVRWAEM